MKHLFTLLLATGLTLPCSAVLQAEQSDWYQVELLIVEQPSATTNGEVWPPFPSLTYPQNGRFLIDPQRLQERLQEHPSAIASHIDNRGRQVLELPPLKASYRVTPPLREAEDIPQASASVAAGDIPQASASAAAATTAASRDANTDADDAPEEAPRLPVSHTLLSASEHEFRDKAAYMARQGGYRILFHERWWQPIPEGQAVRPIILDHSGDGGSWPLLQGSIMLSRSRYLHLTTRLWLNTPGETFPGNGRMPTPPRGPASLVLKQQDARALTWLLAPGVLPPRIDTQLFPRPHTVEPAPEWPWQHAVTLEQQRRMRSGEIHYLDHPRLGLIIKLTALDRETLEGTDYDRDWYHLATGIPLQALDTGEKPDLDAGINAEPPGGRSTGMPAMP